MDRIYAQQNPKDALLLLAVMETAYNQEATP